MTYSTYTVTIRRIEEDVPHSWSMFDCLTFSDGSKYIFWHIHLEPSPHQQQSADISCAEEWRQAEKMCRQLFAQPNPPYGLTGGHGSLNGCMKGFVSARCGGNPV